MKIDDNKILVEQKTGGTPKSGKTGGTSKSGKTGGTGKTGGGGTSGSGGTGQQTTPAPAPQQPPAPQPQQPTIQRQDPLPQPEPKKDVNFCKCWTSGNFFDDDFSKDERNSMANKFYSFVSKLRASKGTFDRVESNVASKNCGDSNCLFYQSPTIRELARAQVATSNLTNTENLYDVWKNSVNQSKEAEAKKSELETKTSSGKYLDLRISDFLKNAKDTNLYINNIDNFKTNLDDLLELHSISQLPATEEKIKKFRGCKETADLYISLFKRKIEDSFGDPDSENLEDYDTRSKYWYVFLKTLLGIKRNLRLCLSTGTSFGDNLAKLRAISQRSIWRIDLNNLENEKEDNDAIAKAKQQLIQDNYNIRKKLIEYKEMKTLKESVRNKILLTKENKDKKVNKISENLYKIAGDFYNERYDVFFNKYVKLKESYKKSKMFLMEGASDNFENALTRVFKGDEDRLVDEAISWFVNKLGLDGSLKTQVEEKLKNKYSGQDASNLFEDDWSDIVVNAVKENAKSDVGEPSSVMDAVEKVLMSKLDSSDFDYQLKKMVSNMIKPAQSEKKDKIMSLADRLKSSIIDSEA